MVAIASTYHSSDYTLPGAVHQPDGSPLREREISLMNSVRRLRYEDLPEEAREAARHCLLDFLGCALAGSRDHSSRSSSTRRQPRGSSEAGLIGLDARRIRRANRGLVNGAAGHALDFDDTHMLMNGTVGPVLPAILVLADAEPVTVAAFSQRSSRHRARNAGSAFIGGGHYEIGFHSTGTLGTFAPAAASAHLLGLDEAGWMRAIGIAGSEQRD